jgi:hypothetical protein
VIFQQAACRPPLFLADGCPPTRRKRSMNERNRPAIRLAYDRRPSGLRAGSPPCPGKLFAPWKKQRCSFVRRLTDVT